MLRRVGIGPATMQSSQGWDGGVIVTYEDDSYFGSHSERLGILKLESGGRSFERMKRRRQDELSRSRSEFKQGGGGGS